MENYECAVTCSGMTCAVTRRDSCTMNGVLRIYIDTLNA